MLCLTDSIRHDDPSVQRLLSAVEDAVRLTELLLAVWQLARVVAVHLVEVVRAERARRPSAGRPAPRVGRRFAVRGL